MRNNKYLYVGITVGILIIMITKVSVTTKDGQSTTNIIATDNISTSEFSSDIKEIEDVESFEISMDDWKDYKDSQYIPEVTTKMIDTLNLKEKPIDETLTKNADLKKVLQLLNPYNAGPTEVMVSDWDIAYGVTQINMKLIPLAKLSYDDFETNQESQIKFLEDYINNKKSLGYSVSDVINSYKLCKPKQ